MYHIANAESGIDQVTGLYKLQVQAVALYNNGREAKSTGGLSITDSRAGYGFCGMHGSWLNIAENELSALSKPCHNRRIPDFYTLKALHSSCSRGSTRHEMDNVVNGMLSIRQHIGVHSTGSGKLFLMQYSEKELDEYIQQGLPALTPHTLTTKRELIYELEKCREHGYAIRRFFYVSIDDHSSRTYNAGNKYTFERKIG